MTATSNGNGNGTRENLLTRNLAVWQFIVSIAVFIIPLMIGIASAWLSLHDQIRDLTKDVSSFASNATTERQQDSRLDLLESFAKVSVEDRSTLHKVIEDRYSESISDRRDLRDRIIRLEARFK